eukprot:CAMPEP_0202690238 /NCGR_PEP_ID=MMETSP1385-20130828/5281_1 /ASSEMBLY_ACC=CAM_ASM_000861 /TAXON_ID=933848 /ORGANISM="Elphidium margaritaceum" /LENGTH=376 /DNA_ID=CAMNT_0049345475 /DNA_START=28 /DNA_END=1158 /DNA_ORIENTATION=-
MPSRSRHRKNYGSMDTRLSVQERSYHDDPRSLQAQDEFEVVRPHKRLNEITDCGEFCEWLKTDTFKKIRFLYFFISIFVAPILALWYYISEEPAHAYVLIGIYALITTAYAMNHFRFLFSLKEQIDRYESKNLQFSEERVKLEQSIEELGSGRRQLSDEHHNLQQANLQMLDMLQKFRFLEKELNNMNAYNYNELNNLNSKSQHIRTKYQNTCLQQQRNILWRIFNRLQRSGRSEGISRDEYNAFERLLPDEHRMRFQRLGGFNGLLSMSGSPDTEYVDADDFTQALDVYATMMVENVDITFRIDRVSVPQQQNTHDAQPKYARKVTILEKKPCQTFYFTKEDVWNAVDDDDDDDEQSPTPMATEPLLRQQRRINE